MNELPMIVDIFLYVIMACASVIFIMITIHLCISLIEDWTDWMDWWKDRKGGNE